MSHIEDEYQKRFENQQLPSDGFDVDGLWDDISDNLDEVPQVPPKGFNGMLHQYLLLFLFVVGGLGILYLTLGKKNTVQPISDKQFNHEESLTETDKKLSKQESKATEQNNQVNAQTIKSENSKSTQLAVKKNNSNEEESKKRTKTKSGKVSSRESSILKNTTRVSGSLLDHSTQEASFISVKNKLENNKPFLNNNTVGNEYPITSRTTNQRAQKNTSTATSKETPIAHVSPLFPLEQKTIKLFALAQYDLPSSVKQAYKKRKPKPVVWQIGLFGGANFNSFKYKTDNLTDLAELKNTTETGEWGISTGLNASLLLKNRWLLSSGLEYHQLGTKFEYKEVENGEVLKENELLKVWIDEITNDTIKTLYGDTFVNATSTRHVLHYNKYKLISIPVEVGLQEDTGKLIFGTTLGAVFSINTFQKGRTLNKDTEIVDFDKESTTASFNNFSVGLRVSPFVGYRIADNWMISASPQMTWQAATNFDETEIKFNARQFNLNVGIGYSFK